MSWPNNAIDTVLNKFQRNVYTENCGVNFSESGF